jgi:UDP-N-acetylmuramoylalanine--D-glutamate ligase
MDLNNKKILILGLGREGKSSLKFLKKNYKNIEVGIGDKKLSRAYLKSIKDYDVIVKSPGIPLKIVKPYLKGKILTSQTDLFLRKHRDITVGVTGTKGKGTTVSLIQHILKKSNKKSILLGNIGIPSLDSYHLNPDVFIYEMSSHQLQHLKISPHIAVLLNAHEGHLDYYDNVKDYHKAKFTIGKYQTKEDFFIHNSDFKEFKDLSKGKKLSFGKRGDCYLKDNYIYLDKKKFINTKDIQLEGDHFIYDIMAGILVCKLLKVPNTIIKKQIKTFKTQEYCLNRIGRYKGITFYNDSFATEPIATIAALRALDNVQTLILGGYERNINFEELAKVIIEKDIKTVAYFKPAGLRIKKELKKYPNTIKFIETDSMREAVKLCHQFTEKGSICLLSPACASFGMFKDYRDRGEQFTKYVKKT